MLITLSCVAAVLLDWRWGEPRRWHPLVGFGDLARWTEGVLYGAPEMSAEARRTRGVVAVLLLLMPFTVVAALLVRLPLLGILPRWGCCIWRLGRAVWRNMRRRLQRRWRRAICPWREKK
jgi:cobalamin biosynthesis protein CobD/CbiB